MDENVLLSQQPSQGNNQPSLVNLLSRPLKSADTDSSTHVDNGHLIYSHHPLPPAHTTQSIPHRSLSHPLSSPHPPAESSIHFEVPPPLHPRGGLKGLVGRGLSETLTSSDGKDKNDSLLIMTDSNGEMNDVWVCNDMQWNMMSPSCMPPIIPPRDWELGCIAASAISATGSKVLTQLPHDCVETVVADSRVNSGIYIQQEIGGQSSRIKDTSSNSNRRSGCLVDDVLKTPFENGISRIVTSGTSDMIGVSRPRCHSIQTQFDNEEHADAALTSHVVVSSQIPPRLQSALEQVVSLDHWPIGSSLHASGSGQRHHHRQDIAGIPALLSTRDVSPVISSSLTQPVYTKGNEYVDDPATSAATVRANENNKCKQNTMIGSCDICTGGHGSSFVTQHNCQTTSYNTAVVANQPLSTLIPPTCCCNKVKKTSTIPISSEFNSATQEDVVPPVHCREGLICEQCGRCRCAYCAGKGRALPSCWMCNGRYECSVRTAVDYCSCLCVVRTLFYHCLYHEDDDVDIVAEPCVCCEAPHCCARWTIIGTLVPFLPCLVCFCPLRCAVEACEFCHTACISRRGCRCQVVGDVVGGASTSETTTATSSSSGATRSLLLDSESSSA